MGQLIQLIIYIVVFAVVAFGLNWVCDRFAMPQPIKWIVGAVLLIILLIFVAQQLGATGGVGVFPAIRR